ncbi:unnamed protein product [Pleuronectes platessa]|uniref:Uncharacterized protein n=1 Tax=Pleuronectes platessa TaxID=8262 RepID=A0A9N7YAQ5_PLEPL|nr:unnamed protein product [Pleuronectes platessa]
MPASKSEANVAELPPGGWLQYRNPPLVPWFLEGTRLRLPPGSEEACPHTCDEHQDGLVKVFSMDELICITTHASALRQQSGWFPRRPQHICPAELQTPPQVNDIPPPLT